MLDGFARTVFLLALALVLGLSGYFKSHRNTFVVIYAYMAPKIVETPKIQSPTHKSFAVYNSH